MSFPQPVIYYPMNINDVNGNKQLVNRASGAPVYDASINNSSTNTSYISQKNYKFGIGSWESPKNSISSSSFVLSTTLTGYTNICTGISVSQDQLKMVISNYDNTGGGNMSYFIRANTDANWSTAAQIPGSEIGQPYYRCGLTADGTRGVVCVNTGFVYVFDWTGTTPSNWKQTDDTTSRAYFGLAITPDGSRMVASTTTYIFFSTWNGTNYNVFTQTLNTTGGIGIGISATGDRIAYGINATNGAWYIAFWNGTNYNKGILLPNFTVSGTPTPRTAYFSNDASILFLSYHQNTTASIYYGKYNPISNSYESFTGITNIPASLDTHGLCYIDGSGNGFLYVKPWNDTNIYIVTVTYATPSYDDQTNITLPTLPATIFGGSGSGYTVATWFRSNFNKTWARIFDFGNGKASNNIVLAINPTAGLGCLYYSVSGSNSYSESILTNYLINDNKWHHIAITSTYVASNSVTSNVIFYLDGVSIQTTLHYYPESIARLKSYIGKSNWSAEPQYYGNIDDFRWYSSVLTQAQITSIYTNDPIINSFVNYQNCTIYNVGGTTTNVQSREGWGQQSNMGNDTYYYWIEPATHTLPNVTNPICFSYTYSNTTNFTNASLFVIIDDGGYVLVNNQNITLTSTTWATNSVESTSINLIPGNNSFKFYCVNIGTGYNPATLAVYVTNGTNFLFNTNLNHTGWTATITGFFYQNIPLNALINVYRTNPTISISASTNYICRYTSTTDQDISANRANSSISPYSTLGYNVNGIDLTTKFYTNTIP